MALNFEESLFNGQNKTEKDDEKKRTIKEIIVDIDGKGDTDNIQEAINMLGSEGGKIIIRTGTYEILKQITINKPNTTIEGEKGTILQTSINGITIFYIAEDDITIKNLYFKATPTNSSNLNFIYTEGTARTNIRIEENIFEKTNTQNTFTGIAFSDYCENWRIEKNKFIKSGIGTDVYCSNIKINENIFEGATNQETILLSQAIGTIISKNIFDVTGKTAIWTQYYFSTGDEGNIISENIFENCTYGVYIDGAGGGKGILINNNKINASTTGIHIRADSNENIISNNWIDATTGIYITGSKNMIISNNLENCSTQYTDAGTNTIIVKGTNTGDQDLSGYVQNPWTSDIDADQHALTDVKQIKISNDTIFDENALEVRGMAKMQVDNHGDILAGFDSVPDYAGQKFWSFDVNGDFNMIYGNINDDAGKILLDPQQRQLVGSDGTSVKFNWETMQFPTLTTNGFVTTTNSDGTLAIATDVSAYETDPIYSSWYNSGSPTLNTLNFATGSSITDDANYLSLNGNNIDFKLGSVSTWIISSGSFYPTTGNLQDLGTAGNTVKDGYFGGTVTATTLTDGTASLSSGALTGLVSATDGTASWSSNSLSGFTSISGTTLTDGTASLTGGSLTGATLSSCTGNLSQFTNDTPFYTANTTGSFVDSIDFVNQTYTTATAVTGVS